MRHINITTFCLVLASTTVSAKLANPQTQFDYRGHHEQAAAKAIGRSVGSSQRATGDMSHSNTVHHEAPRLKGKYYQQKEPERWAQYVPEGARSSAVEISEARREAREIESKRIQEEQQQQQQQQEEEKRRAKAREGKESKEAKRKGNILPSSLQDGVQRVKSVTKRTGRKARSKVQHLFEDGDDDDDDDDDEYDEDEDEYNGRRRRRSSKRTGIPTRIWSVLIWLFTGSYRASAWSGRHLLWTPSTYVGEAIRWSAQTSWKTTRWTGERALVGPALTAGAPLIYLAEGLLFIFVFMPAQIIGVLARELYPIYIYLGAALAVGTAMGLGSALILFIGSFILSDSSSVEQNISRRADFIPEDLQRRFGQRKKVSPAKKWAKKGESIIERAIQESIERDKREKQYSRRGSKDRGSPVAAAAAAAESDEDDDDYFGDAKSLSYKGKTRSNDVTPTGSLRRNTPVHFGPPLPLGATGHGGWSSSTNSTPVSSPVAVRPNLPNVTPFAYSSARSGGIVQSPLTSPDVLRSASSRQRRGINSSS